MKPIGSHYVSILSHVYILRNNIDTKCNVILNKLNLTESELKVLEVISKEGNVSVSHLCDKTKFAPSMVRRTVASLDRKGLIRKYRVGLPKEISLSDSKHALTFRDMVLEDKL